MVYLGQNNSFKLSDNLTSRIIDQYSIEPGKGYYELCHHPLAEKLIGINKINGNDIILDNGADGCLMTLFLWIKEIDGCLWLPNYSYSGFEKISKPLGINIKFYENLSHLPRNLSQNDFLLICHPFNPTGVSQRDDISNLLENSRAYVIVDESYIDYCIEQSFTKQASDSDRLIVIRSFSKGFGLPQLRIGYMVGRNIGTLLEGYKIPFSNSLCSLNVASNFLDNFPIWHKEMSQFKEAYKLLQLYLIKKNYRFVLSETNFIFLPLKENPNFYNLMELLEEFYIEIKYLNSEKGLGARVSFHDTSQIIHFYNRIKEDLDFRGTPS